VVVEDEMVVAVVALAAASVGMARLVPLLEQSQSTNYARRPDTRFCVAGRGLIATLLVKRSWQTMWKGKGTMSTQHDTPTLVRLITSLAS
jgi:hypothetical protein